MSGSTMQKQDSLSMTPEEDILEDLKSEKTQSYAFDIQNSSHIKIEIISLEQHLILMKIT